PNSFTIITANRLLSFCADTEDEADGWVDAIKKTKEREAEEGLADVVEQGWLIKEGPNDSRRKRWFVLTGNSLDYFKSYAKGSPRFGSIILNSLCSVIPPSSQDDTKEGDYIFTVNGRKRSYVIHAKSYDEATKWTSAIQDVIDTKLTIDTPFAKLMVEVKNAHDNEEVDKLYQRNPILRYTKLALRAPLLALPYGHSQSVRAKDKGYGTFHEEAIRIFSSLQEQESVADPIPVIQGILQTCHDLKPLRDEVFCQLLKQTTSAPDFDSIGNLKNWQVIVCMCCTFIPSRKILRYLRSHLRRSRDHSPDTEMAKFATFCLECIKRTRPREFPPSRAEIIACLGRRDLAAIVYTFGEGAHCKIEINSATTAGAVVRQLCKGLNITQEDNLFGLFEKCGTVEKHIEGRTVVADVLAKFERYKALRLNEKGQRWQLYFKIFCFLNPSEVATDSVEGLFLFEQFCENVAQGRFPAAENILCRLASLRLQYTKGDYEPGAWVDNMSSVFPVQKIKRLRDRSSSKANSLGREKISGTLIGSIRKVVSPLVSRGLSEEAEEKAIEEAEQKAESSYIKSSICDYWKGHQGLTCQEAQEQYIEILQKWPGYCSTLFDVKSTKANFPPELWLGVSLEGIAVYKRYESRAIMTCEYEYILSFGAPQSNTYKIIAEGRGEMVFETSQLTTDPACGNGFIEVGEECDCGAQEDCEHVNDTCCNYTSCMLYEEAQCADGVCCGNCQFISRGTVCRQSVNSCDVPEYCNGTNEVCPADLVTVNGISCDNNQGYCHGGECRTHDDQCDQLWTGSAFKAVDICYQYGNMRGDEHGYCKKLSQSTYMACTAENVQCGKLMCIGNSTITPKNLGFGWRSSALLSNGLIICRSTRIFQGGDLPELGTVLNGTKCGDEMVCYNNECVSLSVASAGQPTCANNCNGNGVCNENGNCHCNPGWKCPDCSQPYNGPGGSIDSGLNCEAVTTTTAAPTPATTILATTTPATTIQAPNPARPPNALTMALVQISRLLPYPRIFLGLGVA
ncbi:Unconventional myosin-X, partial [Paramuricea clavata]